MPKLTKTLIESTTARTADVWLWCPELPGFGVRVQRSGRKVYVVRYRTHARQQRTMTLARYADMNIEQARALARKAFQQVAEGFDPLHCREELRDAPTMDALAERYMREHARPFKKPRSASNDAGLWRNVILPRWGSRRVADIRRADILELHGSLSLQPAKANQTLALLSKAMNLAEVWEWRQGMSNPCRGVRRYRVRHHERVLTPDEIRRLDETIGGMVRVREVPASFQLLIRLLLLTGCRLTEIMHARRDWVDVDRRLLLLPDSKVGQRCIGLSRAAVALIEAQPAHPYLIPGRRQGDHLRSPWRAWHEACRRASVPRARLHDLRHTVGSLAHRAGLSQRAIADLLGHRQLATTARYLHGARGDLLTDADTVAGVIGNSLGGVDSRPPLLSNLIQPERETLVDARTS